MIAEALCGNKTDSLGVRRAAYSELQLETAESTVTVDTQRMIVHVQQRKLKLPGNIVNAAAKFAHSSPVLFLVGKTKPYLCHSTFAAVCELEALKAPPLTTSTTSSVTAV